MSHRGTFGGGKKRGEYRNNTWYCDCDPRLPAEHFQVKKQGANMGRWFYTCRKCGFFRWDEEAKRRMEAAVLASSPNEAGTTPAASQRMSPPPAYSAQPASGAAKRKFQEEFDGEDEDFRWTPEARTNEEISRAMAPPPVTPRKAAKATDYSTPSSSGGMPTPASYRTNGFSAGSRFAEPAMPSSQPTGTPSPGESDVGESLVPEVMDLLTERRVYVDAETREALRKVLRDHALRAQGLARGRDISRLAVRERNAKMGELQARITALEAELETQKAVINNLLWQKETGQFD